MPAVVNAIEATWFLAEKKPKEEDLLTTAATTDMLVIGVGLPRTVTKSLKEAFGRLGMKRCHMKTCCHDGFRFVV